MTMTSDLELVNVRKLGLGRLGLIESVGFRQFGANCQRETVTCEQVDELSQISLPIITCLRLPAFKPFGH